MRQVKQFLPPSESSKAIVAEFANRQVIWCYALGESLRRVPFSERVQEYITSQNINEQNVPNSILNSHSAALTALNISEFNDLPPHEKPATYYIM